MPSLTEIETKLNDYCYLPQKDIIKLIAGFCLTCKLPTNPLWLFIASGSSAGKTMIIELFERVPGFTQVDNMTANSLQSGMKRHDASASFLDRFPKEGGFIVFKDFTTMMSKNPEVLAEIMGQLRIVYDGSSVKLTGGVQEEQKWEGKLSMLGAGTGVLYSKNDQFADMGQRMIIYNFDQADDYEISNFLYNHQKDDRKALKSALQELIREYVASIPVPKKFDELPTIDREVWDELTDIAHIATTARSPVERNRYGHSREVLSKGFKEAATRMFNQIVVASYGLMLQNPDKKLSPEDKKLLFKLGLDCIDPRRRKVLQALTKFNYGGGLDEIAEEIGYTKGSAEVFTQDLEIFGMVRKERVAFHSGHKTIYKIADKYREIMEKFDHIIPENRSMTIEPEPLPPEPPPLSAAEQAAINIFN
jgi:predicted transcriptional regulator